MTPDTCPICGADVPVGARACPECGADEDTGWSDEARVSGLNLPDGESFDYDDFVQREFGGRQVRPRGVRPLWWLVAIVVVVAFVTGLLMLK